MPVSRTAKAPTPNRRQVASKKKPVRQPSARHQGGQGVVQMQQRLGNRGTQALLEEQNAIKGRREIRKEATNGNKSTQNEAEQPNTVGSDSTSDIDSSSFVANEVTSHAEGKGAAAQSAAVAMPVTDEAAIGGAEASTVELIMPEPPIGLSEADQQRLQSVGVNAGTAARSQETLPSADENVSGARSAVEEPIEETAARASAGLATALGEQPEPSPEIEGLCERIKQAICDRRPPDEDALLETNPSEEAEAAGGMLQSAVEADAQRVESNYEQLNETPQGTPQLQPEAIDAPPEVVGAPDFEASTAVPDAVPNESVSLDADVESSAARIESAGMNAEPAQLVQSGPIAEAHAAQDELSETARRDPQKVLTEQQAARDSVRSDMVALQQQALEALQSSRSQTIGRVNTQQHGMVETEAQMRTRISGQAQDIFNQAQQQVNDWLSPLTQMATERWETGVAELSTQFERDLERIDNWKKERHSGITGSIVAVWDDWTGLPGWMIEAYNQAESNFGQGVCRLLREISIEVNGIIATCERFIDDANQEISALFTDLPENLQSWADGEQARFSEQLNSLHERVISTRDDFNRDLSQRASQSVQEVRERIHELRQAARGIIGRVADAIEAFAEDPARFIIDGLLELVGISPASFWALINRIQSVISDIADDPLGFANNLAAALGQGFQQFFDNFKTHVIDGFFEWLFSGLGSVGVQIPSDFSLGNLITFFLQLMGITWDRIRGILAKHIGEENVALIEQAYELIAMLVEQGPSGIFEMIKEQLDPKTILDSVLEAAVDFMVEALIAAVTPRVIAMFNPAGAIVQAVELIYRVLDWVFTNAARIFTLVETVVNGAAELIAGNFSGMANAVEGALVRIIAPVIDFLAGFLGMGDLPDQIADTIRGFQEMVLTVIDHVVEWLVLRARSLLQKMGILEEEQNEEESAEDPGNIGLSDLDEPPVSADRTREEMDMHIERVNQLLNIISAQSDTTSDIENYFPSIIRRYRLKKLEYMDQGGDRLGILIEINPKEYFDDFPTTIKVKADDWDDIVVDIDQVKPKVETEQIVINGPNNNTLKNMAAVEMVAPFLGSNHPLGASTSGTELPGLFNKNNGGLPTSAGKSNYEGNEVFVRGHLLNADLGGPAEDRNLFPITQSANTQHYNNVEKDLVHDVNQKGLLVSYGVLVDKSDLDLANGDMLTKFICTVSDYNLDKQGNLVKGREVRVTITSRFMITEGPEERVITSSNNDGFLSNAVGDTSNVQKIKRYGGSGNRMLITEANSFDLSSKAGIAPGEAEMIISELKRNPSRRYSYFENKLTDQQLDLVRKNFKLYAND